MLPDYSAEALMRFLNYIDDKGLVGKQKAQNWRVASPKIVEFFSDEEKLDVRRADIDSAFHRFSNKRSSEYTPKTLEEYRRRTVAALSNFVAWASNPSAYRPTAGGGSRRRDSIQVERSQSSEPNERTGVGVAVSAPAQQPLNSALSFPFPLRDDFLVQLVIPRDLNTEEAKRIGAFVLALARDVGPSK
jgi:hypothetical protein